MPSATTKQNITPAHTTQDIERHLMGNEYRWLVTGVAGFIGSNLAHRLLKLNQTVIGLDDFSTGQKCNIEELNKKYGANEKWKFVEGDIRQIETGLMTTKNVDFVLHQAAIGSVPRSIEDPLLSHSANVDGFVKILFAAKENRVRKLVYASSSSVYGDHPALPKKEDNIGESLSPYAATKRIDEIYAQVFGRCYGMKVTGLRYFNVFGPRQNPQGPYAAVIPLWIQSMIDNAPVYINGDGSYSRDFCYIENVVQANIRAALQSGAPSGKVYNVAFGDRTDLSHLFEYIREALLPFLKGRTIANAQYRETRPGDIPHSHADISQARKDLGYEPTVPVKEGLQKTVEFYIKNKTRGSSSE